MRSFIERFLFSLVLFVLIISLCYCYSNHIAFVELAPGEETHCQTWDENPDCCSLYHRADGSYHLQIHGYEGLNCLYWRKKQTNTQDVVKILVQEGRIKNGSVLHIHCCFPGDKVAGEEAGVKYDFYGNKKWTTRASPTFKGVWIHY